jgi:hypothetical protein
MKHTSIILILFVALFATSCEKPTDMLTVINSDGSCYRQFTEKADSAFMCGDTIDKSNPFPIKIDSTCNVSWKYGKSDLRTEFPLSRSLYDSLTKRSGSFDVVVRQDFKSVEEMAHRFKFKPSHEWSNMKVKYALEKKFRWFYTYYMYRETYPKIETGFTLPIENFMSKDEARFWFTGEPNILQGMNGFEIRNYIGELEDKYNQWFAKSVWDAQYAVVLANYDLIGNVPVTRKRLELLKDSIFNSEVKVYQDFKMESILNKYFNTKVFSKLWKAENSPMKELETKFDNQPLMKYLSQSFTYKLILPGEIIKSNNAVVKGDTLVWNLTSARMVYGNYVLEAQSRKVNIWAFVITGLLLIIAVGSFIYKPRDLKK